MMYLNDEIKRELDYFKRMNEHFTINAGKSTTNVSEASDEISYMALSASLAMDLFEEGFFENFHITDKFISGKQELQLDAYAFIETESTNEKHLHLFQYKLHQTDKNATSPTELRDFATLMNDTFVHPELRDNDLILNPVLNEIDQQVQSFLSKKGRKIAVYCHFINNAQGINRSNNDAINSVLGRFEQDKQLYRFNIQVYGLQDIIDLAVDGKIRVVSENIDFILDGQHSFRYEDNTKRTSLGLPKRVFIGMCNVNEFIRLQNKYHNNQLYAENIRLYLGDRGAVNKDIINTITNIESIWFPYMNNGISIICDEITLGTPKANSNINVELKNLQIINGCQTVNALFSAKYGEKTKDNFKPANILVRIYEIDSSQADFKLNVIKATNNQNAVKTYSLLANDPLQIAIGNTIKEFDYLYDRKGEAKHSSTKKIVSMPNGALAYRAVYMAAAQSLRSRMGESRVFQKTEYEKIYKNSALDDNEELFLLSSKLLSSSIILDTIRDLVREKSDSYIATLPVFKKSTYYIAGLIYALNKREIDDLTKNMVDLLIENNYVKTKGIDIPNKIINLLKDKFSSSVDNFTVFYNSIEIEKTDIDNLLKSSDFGKLYKKHIESISGALEE
ncbi:AIPR family protein [Flavobacterium sp.]|uniref:AIPR family protein n=1 Tax=Flavobacterium sp. TaxID=239 RepID=UPI0037BF268D